MDRGKNVAACIYWRICSTFVKRRGHGTILIQDQDETQLVSSVCGAVKRVNKLVMMQPFKGRCITQFCSQEMHRTASLINILGLRL